MSYRNRRMTAGGRTCGGMNQPPCNGGYRRGGSTRRRFGHGGHTNSRSYRKRDNSGTGRSH